MLGHFIKILEQSIGKKFVFNFWHTILRQLEKSYVKFCHCGSCAGRKSNVTAVLVNCVFIITTFPIFTRDIPFGVGEMYE
jgi:hypothetical protein